MKVLEWSLMFFCIFYTCIMWLDKRRFGSMMIRQVVKGQLTTFFGK